MATGDAAMGEYERNAARNAIIAGWREGYPRCCTAAFARDWHAGRWFAGGARVPPGWPHEHIPCVRCAAGLPSTAKPSLMQSASRAERCQLLAREVRKRRRRVQRGQVRRAELVASGQGLLW
jgi:hypothetical protein